MLKTIFCGAIVAAFVSVSMPALAIDSGPPSRASAPGSTTDGQPRSLTKHVLQYTLVRTGSPGVSIPQETNTYVDPATDIVCPSSAANGCTIFAKVSVQIDPAGDTTWAICPVVDGNQMFGGCEYMGTAVAAQYTLQTVIASMSVSAGTHHVRSYVFLLSSTGTAATYYVEYSLATP